MVVLQLLFTALSGAIFSFSFKPIGLWFAAPVAFALLFHQLRSKRFPVLHAVLFAFVANLIILSWTSTFVGATPWLLLVFLQSIFYIPLGIASQFSKQIPLYIFVIIVYESLKSRFPLGGFGWTRIAFSQVESPLAPLVSILGVTALSAATLVTSYAIVERNKFALLLLMITLLVAQFSLSPALTKDSIRVRAIQGGVPERGLEFNARAMEVLDNHIEVTLSEMNGEEDLFIWPENAIDVDPIENPVVAQKIRVLAEQINTPLLAGAILDNEKLLNTTLLFDANGKAESIYVKRYLTPFGEYIPLRSIAEKISSDTDRVTDFSSGDRLIVHKVGVANVGSVICYEILNDGLVREMAMNSDFLVVHTNSATFSGSSEGEQQLAITRLRALETGKSIVSISTTGPSAIIDSTGVVKERSVDGQMGSVSAQIDITNDQTLASQLGGFGEISVLLFLILWSSISVVKGRNL